jgi:hypothetical protein
VAQPANQHPLQLVSGDRNGGVECDTCVRSDRFVGTLTAPDDSQIMAQVTRRTFLENPHDFSTSISFDEICLQTVQ